MSVHIAVYVYYSVVLFTFLDHTNKFVVGFIDFVKLA